MKKILIPIISMITVICIFCACGKIDSKDLSISPGTTADPLASEYYAQTETLTNGDTTAIRDDYIDQESSGIVVDTMSVRVRHGQVCMISATGTPDSEFTIQVYHDYGTRFEIEGLEDGKSDEKGVVQWSFIVPENTQRGAKAVIIREKGTGNYVRAAFSVV